MIELSGIKSILLLWNRDNHKNNNTTFISKVFDLFS